MLGIWRTHSIVTVNGLKVSASLLVCIFPLSCRYTRQTSVVVDTRLPANRVRLPEVAASGRED